MKNLSGQWKASTAEIQDELSTTILQGFAASGGTAEGQCTIIKEQKDLYNIPKGAIITFDTASPELITFMPYLKGLITRKGGALSTLSWHARRHGVPAVFGIEGLMDSVNDGDMVRIDGENGKIEILR